MSLMCCCKGGSGGGCTCALTANDPLTATDEGGGSFTLGLDCNKLIDGCLKPNLAKIVAPCSSFRTVHAQISAGAAGQGGAGVFVGFLTVQPPVPYAQLEARVSTQSQWTWLPRPTGQVLIYEYAAPCARSLTVEVREVGRPESAKSTVLSVPDTCTVPAVNVSVDVCADPNQIKVTPDGLFVPPGSASEKTAITATAPVTATGDSQGNYTIALDCTKLVNDCVKPTLDRIVSPCEQRSAVKVQAQALSTATGTSVGARINDGTYIAARPRIQARVQGEATWVTLPVVEDPQRGYWVALKDYPRPCERTLTIEFQEIDNDGSRISGPLIIATDCQSAFPLQTTVTACVKGANLIRATAGGLIVSPDTSAAPPAPSVTKIISGSDALTVTPASGIGDVTLSIDKTRLAAQTIAGSGLIADGNTLSLDQNALLEGPQTAPPSPLKTLRDNVARRAMYGTFHSNASWAVGGPVDWDAPTIRRIPVQSAEYGQGLVVANGLINPVEKGQLWEVTCYVYATASQACTIWGRMEGLRPTVKTAFDTDSVHIPAATTTSYAMPLIITDVGVLPDLEAASNGFGSVLVRCDKPGVATIVYARWIVKNLGPAHIASNR